MQARAASSHESGDPARERPALNGPRYLSVQDVAVLAGLSPRAIYGAIGRGELTAFRVCSRLRIHPDHVAEWMRASVVQPAAPVVVQPARPVVSGPTQGLRRLLDSNGIAA